MAGKISPKGKEYVLTEPGEALATRSLLGYLLTPDGTPMQVRRAFVDAATNGTREVVPAVADKVIRVIALNMIAGATATTVTFKSASTAISPTYALAANGGMVLNLNEHGWLQGLDVNEALNATLSNGADVGILVLFVEVPADAFDLL